MNCEILETLYVRSNGDIPCNDDAGEPVIIGKVVPEDLTWGIEKVFENEHYASIRSSLSSGKVPWEDICTRCAFFRRDEPFSDTLIQKRIRNIQIEPSLACNLECPCCSNMTQIHSRPKPHLMKLEVLETLMRNLVYHSYSVGEVLYSGQGDPLMHPKFPDFVRTVRKYCPDVYHYLCTNGNFDYWKSTEGVPIDTIFVSCDGVFQENYEKYRVGGNVEKPIKFMRDIPRFVDGRKQRVIWKYILFEFNDSEKEIIAAQELANSLGVDTLLFVFTHSRYKSIKFRPENQQDLPIVFPNVKTDFTHNF